MFKLILRNSECFITLDKCEYNVYMDTEFIERVAVIRSVNCIHCNANHGFRQFLCNFCVMTIVCEYCFINNFQCEHNLTLNCQHCQLC